MEWMKSYLCLMLVFILVSHLTPKEEYRKYFQFYLGILLAITFLRPVIGWVSVDSWQKALYEVENLYEEMSKVSFEAEGNDVYAIFLGEGHDR